MFALAMCNQDVEEAGAMLIEMRGDDQGEEDDSSGSDSDED